MAKLQNGGVERMGRRDAIARVAGAGLGVVSMLRGTVGVMSAQGQAPLPVPPAPNPNFPRVPSWKTELRKLAPNVFAYVQAGGPGTGSGAGISNAGVIVGPDHLMAIDALGAPLHTKAFMAAVRNAVGNKAFGRLVNTHHHGDHTNCNQYFLPAEIVGHPFCQQSILEMAAAIPPGAKFQKREGWAEGTEERKLVAPGTTFTDRMTYHYGDTLVELIHPGIAHTWGDVLVYLPQYKILFAGDIGFFYITPFSHNGHVTKWLEVIEKVMAMDVETIVPGHGPIGGKKELAEMGEFYQLLKREARKRFDAGMGPGRAAADIRMGRFDNWIGMERIVMNTFRLYAEFNGSLTPVLDQEGLGRAIEEYNAVKAAAPSQ